MARSPSTARLLALLARFDRGIETVEKLMLSGGVILMAAVSIANVIGRNLFDHSLIFAEEINQILMILITFMGIGYGVRHARHIRMSAVYDQLDGFPRKALMVVISLGTGLLLLLLAWYAIRYVDLIHRIGSVTPVLRVPLWAIYVWVPVGLTLGGVQYLLATVRNLTTADTYLSFQQKDAYEEPGSGD
ncbi:MAG: TRAP transporter small permease [Chromatiales bacterium]